MARPRGNDLLTLKATPRNPITDLIYDDFSPTLFVVGYGATRRVEANVFSDASSRKSRGLRYLRVASLFEDHVALRPMQAWFPRLSRRRRKEAINLLNAALPASISFAGEIDGDDYVFVFEDARTPFPALSDGYRAFIGWVGDLIGHLCSLDSERALVDHEGIVLVDEIDLHLHPSWQRDVVDQLSKAFPRLQFVFTSHSPLVAASVQSSNVVVTGTAEDGSAVLEKMDESLYGRGIESVLLSPYFGLSSARPPQERAASRQLARAAQGNETDGIDDAEEFLRRLARPIENLIQRSGR